MISRTSLLASTALTLSLCAWPAAAQTQSKENESAASAKAGEHRAQQKEQDRGSAHSQSQEKGKASAQSEQPRQKGSAQTHEPRETGKGSAQTQQNREQERGSAQTHQPRETGRGNAQGQPQEKSRGSAKTEQPQERGKGTATNTGKGTTEKGSDTAKAPSRSGGVQLSERQRTDVHSAILRESSINRASNVTFSIHVGTRIPRSVRLAPLPASVFAVVPQFRSYQYFVVNDQICIVEPRTYEIVDVISEPGRMAGTQNRGSAAPLVLTEAEKRIIVRNVDMDSGNTLGLGALTEGASVPRNAHVKTFPDAVVQQVPKVRNYKYVSAEDRVAIVDPQDSKVQLVIEQR